MHSHESIFQHTPNPLTHTCWVCGSCTLATGQQGGSGLIPYVLLRGHWLATYGFVIGARLRVDVRHELMTIRVVDAPQPAALRIPPNFRRQRSLRARTASQDGQLHRQAHAQEPPSWMCVPPESGAAGFCVGGRYG
jgi:hypothetical protein